MSSLAETNYQYEIYIDGPNPMFLTKWMPPPDNLVPFIGDWITIRGDHRMFKVIRFEPSTLSGILPINTATKIYVEIVDPLQPETNDNTMNPIEYQLINNIF